MKLDGARVLLTGASGGIGSSLAAPLLQRGARLVLIGRNESALKSLRARLDDYSGSVHTISADLLDPVSRERSTTEARDLLGGVDILVNCAGQTSFRPFQAESPEILEQIIQLNLLTPMLLVRQLLPEMVARGDGRIVNVGSTFGSIGFAWFAAYSASKFGLRGFSEALRRELDGTGVTVTYVAPRAVKTALNSSAVYRMAEATNMRVDDPAWVAGKIVAAIEKDAKDIYLGSPEKYFARLNSLLPRLVDTGLRKQNRLMKRFAVN
ncbi:MAG: SDR family oxidoreductase [Chromatiaceae bacterium]|nr:SDR family oxidoreductase [Chromatiaceae bacterium]MCP5444511.1 SDR family oxidoreductase [Chromatiaceae bacterium]